MHGIRRARWKSFRCLIGLNFVLFYWKIFWLYLKFILFKGYLYFDFFICGVLGFWGFVVNIALRLNVLLLLLLNSINKSTTHPPPNSSSHFVVNELLLNIIQSVEYLKYIYFISHFGGSWTLVLRGLKFWWFEIWGNYEKKFRREWYHASSNDKWSTWGRRSQWRALAQVVLVDVEGGIFWLSWVSLFLHRSSNLALSPLRSFRQSWGGAWWIC